jgi:hypothetical protein
MRTFKNRQAEQPLIATVTARYWHQQSVFLYEVIKFNHTVRHNKPGMNEFLTNLTTASKIYKPQFFIQDTQTTFTHIYWSTLTLPPT